MLAKILQDTSELAFFNFKLPSNPQSLPEIVVGCSGGHFKLVTDNSEAGRWAVDAKPVDLTHHEQCWKPTPAMQSAADLYRRNMAEEDKRNDLETIKQLHVNRGKKKASLMEDDDSKFDVESESFNQVCLCILGMAAKDLLAIAQLDSMSIREAFIYVEEQQQGTNATEAAPTKRGKKRKENPQPANGRATNRRSAHAFNKQMRNAMEASLNDRHI